MPSAPRLSDYKPEDGPELVRMWRAAFEHGVGVQDPHPIEAQLAYLHQKVVPQNTLRLAWRGSVLAGFIAFNPESVAQLHVRVGFHRQGIGSHLLGLAQAQSTGSLWLFTFQKNLVARRFYEHHGFRAVSVGFEPMWQLEDLKYQWLRAGPAAC
jgi:putative acetyltransferase